MDDLLDALARLTAYVENLEHRVSTLEQPSTKPAFVRSESVGARPTAEALPFGQAAGVFPVLGKAMLGIGGAYLLRGSAESGSFAKLAVAVLRLLMQRCGNPSSI